MGNREDPIIALCRTEIERGSKSFAAAARLLPPDLRASTYMLYAWCRHCDDVIDGQRLGFPAHDSDKRSVDATELVEQLRLRTVAACRGEPDDPVFEALARVVKKHEIPTRHPLELIDGFAMDAEGRTCDTLADTLLYAYHVAGVVGLMMARVMGVRHTETLRRAADLGIAFQLTNIARDVAEDAANGRIYLPQNWLAAAGITAERVDDPLSRVALANVTANLLDVADDYYRSALYGIADLPFRSAVAIAAARSVYRAIGTTVRQRKAAAWDRRASVPKAHKMAIIALAPPAVLRARLLRSVGVPPRDHLWTHPGLSQST